MRGVDSDEGDTTTASRRGVTATRVPEMAHLLAVASVAGRNEVTAEETKAIVFVWGGVERERDGEGES